MGPFFSRAHRTSVARGDLWVPDHRALQNLLQSMGEMQGEDLTAWATFRLSHPIWNNFFGRRPGDVVRRELVHASHERRLGRVAGSVQMDVSNMFDRVCHCRLLLAVAWAGFRLCLLQRGDGQEGRG